MAHIKKMVMHGFKSFAQKTEIVFDQGINVVIGPNGSGKSNISDALCFVLGRLSIKSMRAAKAKNLIFMGSKYIKPAHEASVELFFDNRDRAFSIDRDEIVLKRAVRTNGQSLYKINGENKTRTEIIELLAQAGIDPHGFNLILQGQIQSIVRMRPEDRRKIIEEVAGIAIYESRKEKSIHELEKTEEKLKEINTVLREKGAYLRNLEEEKKEAEKFKDLELNIRRCKASILNRKIEDKQKEVEDIKKAIGKKTEEKDKIKTKSEKLQAEINALGEKINQINKTIQQATGIERETLHTQVADLRADLEGLRVRKENYENRKAEIERRIEEVSKSIPTMQNEIQELKKESPLMAKKAQELKKKKDELAKIEEERKILLSLKSELISLRDRTRDKERQLARITSDSEFTLKQLEKISINLHYKSEHECANSIHELKTNLVEKKKLIEELNQKEMESEKISSVAESKIERANEVKSKVENIDICPLCQSKITGDHKEHVFKDADDNIKKSKDIIEEIRNTLNEVRNNKINLLNEIRLIEDKIVQSSGELHKHREIGEKKEALRKLVEDEKAIKNEIKTLDDRRKTLEAKTFDVSKIEEEYFAKIRDIEEVSSRTSEDVDTTLLYKEREIEKLNNIIKESHKGLVELNEQITEISKTLEHKSSSLADKEQQEKELNEKFKKLFEERDKIQIQIQESSLALSELQNGVRAEEDQINYLKVGEARLSAEKEAFEMEITEYSGVELIKASMNVLEERLQRAQEGVMKIGSINLRALEVYEAIKKEYDLIVEKVTVLDKEKQDIMAIIAEIDKKKTREFMKSFKAINELFSNNFSRLSTKGQAFLEIENQEDIFKGGLNIIVKLAKGKYFDVTSLSGGEQTLVALSLLFAIQEHKPYHFYVFDEIDAALDKRNSEKLAALLNRYMKAGQYIVVTHNDALIINANVLYGVSMHDGVSKILSLKISEEARENAPNNQPPSDENPPSST
jgi:chromosome segregation protein